MAYGLPFISGKDSLNNEFSLSADEAVRTGLPERIAIPYTLLISAMGLVDDVRHCVSMDLKRPGSFLVVRPLDRQSLAGDRKGGPITLVEYDNLGARADDLTGMVEGREATQPFRPAKVPYDAYCACILDSVNFQPVLEVA